MHEHSPTGRNKERPTPLDVLAMFSRAVDAAICWYLAPAWRRGRLRSAVSRGWVGHPGSRVSIPGPRPSGDGHAKDVSQVTLSGVDVAAVVSVRGGVVHVFDHPGPHAEVPQNEQLRVAVPGYRVPSGAPSTLIVIRSPERDSWCFYIDSDPNHQIAVRVDQVGPLVELLSGNGDAA